MSPHKKNPLLLKNLFPVICNLSLFIIFITVFLPNYTQAHNIFTNETYILTSFSNKELYNNKYRYSINSFHKKIYMDFPIQASPFQTITVYGSINNNSIYISDSNNIEYLSQALPLLQQFSAFRLTITDKVLQLYPNSSAFILALTLGNRSFLPQEFLDFVSSSGLIHLFALSGLHLVIVLSLFVFLLSRIGVSYQYINIFSIPISLSYLLLGGFGISLQRAFLFHLINSIFIFIRIPILPSRLFILALFINILLFPSNIFSLSLVLSYAAVGGIVFLYKICYDMIYKKLNNSMICSYLAVSLSASLFVIPILILYFNTFNILSFIASAIIVPFMPLVLICCFFALLCSIVHIDITWLDTIINILYQYIYYFARFFAEIPFTTIFFNNNISKYGTFTVFILLIIFLLVQKRNSYEFME